MRYGWLQRENTLLKEFEQSAKSSVFHDRRIGERDETLPEFDKAILRQQREHMVCAGISLLSIESLYQCSISLVAEIPRPKDGHTKPWISVLVLSHASNSSSVFS
jgi:hypothetical protein